MSVIENPETAPARMPPPSPMAGLEIALEPHIDLRETAELLDRSFPQGYRRDSSYLDWLYHHSCDHRALVVAARLDGAKVGQMVFIPHETNANDTRQLLGQTVDFFVVPEHRQAPVVIQLTRQALEICRAQGLDGITGVPNIKSLPIVCRFMKTRPTRKLGLRTGLALPIRRRSIDTSVEAHALDDVALQQFLAPYVRETSNARIWSSRSLGMRLATPVTRFALHTCADALAISCRFPIKGVDFTMLCGFLSRTSTTISREVVTALVGAACTLHRRPNYCYIGVNNGLEQLPGFEISERIHASPLTVVARTVTDRMPTFTPDRYEMIDFDMV